MNKYTMIPYIIFTYLFVISMTGLVTTISSIPKIDVIKDNWDYLLIIVTSISAIISAIASWFTVYFAKRTQELEQSLSKQSEELQVKMYQKQQNKQKLDLLFREDVLRCSCTLSKEDKDTGSTETYHCLIFKNNTVGDLYGWMTAIYDLRGGKCIEVFSTKDFVPTHNDQGESYIGPITYSFPTKQSLIYTILLNGFDIIDPVYVRIES